MTEMVDFLRYRRQQSVTVASRERGRVMIIMERKAADALHWRAAGSRTL
jgi:septum formation topological specificity factor MinE